LTVSDNELQLQVVAAAGGAVAGSSQAFHISLLAPRSILALDKEVQMLSGATPRVAIPQYLGDHTGNWSLWLQLPNQDSAHLVEIRLLNNVDGSGKTAPSGQWGSLGPASVSLNLPLKLVQQQTAAEIRYAYTGRTDTATLDFSLLPPQRPVPVQVPKVTLTAKQGEKVVRNIYALAIGTQLSIAWEVAKGPWQAVSGLLMGPLPLGRGEISLDPDSAYPPDKGEMAVSVVGDQAYAVQVTLKMADGALLSVIRSLDLKVASPGQYGAISLSPDSILPNGPVTVHWAAWGVNTANLAIIYPPNTLEDETVPALPESRPPGAAVTGQGEYTFPAPPAGETTVTLNLWIKKGTPPVNVSQQVVVATWGDLALQDLPAQRAISLAYDQGGWLVFCTADGALYRAFVGLDDRDRTADKRCTQIGQLPNTARWLAVTGYPDAPGFAALRTRTTGETELVRFNVQATTDPDAPGITLGGMAGVTRGQLVATTEQIYITGVVEASQPGPFTPRALTPLPQALNRRTGFLGEELALMAARGAALLTLDGALYALHQDTGDLLRFDYDGVALGWPKAAASAPVVDGASAVAKGTPVVVEDVLVVVGSGQGDQSQDHVYSARYDIRTTCGHGLQLDSGVLAYRGGGSQRLYALGGVRPGGMSGDRGQTLTLPDYLDMFAPEAISTNSPVPLENDYLDTDLSIPSPLPAPALPRVAAVLRGQAIDSGLPDDLSFALVGRGEGDAENLAPFALTLAEDRSLRLSYRLNRLPTGFLGLRTRTGAYWYYLYEDPAAKGRLSVWPVPAPVVKELKATPQAFPRGTQGAGEAGNLTFTLRGAISLSPDALAASWQPVLKAASSDADRALRLSDLTRRAIPVLSADATAGGNLVNANVPVSVNSDGSFAVLVFIAPSATYLPYAYRLTAANLSGLGSASLDAARANAYTARLTSVDVAGFDVNAYQQS
jgi:hypothetical protein